MKNQTWKTTADHANCGLVWVQFTRVTGVKQSAISLQFKGLFGDCFGGILGLKSCEKHKQNFRIPTGTIRPKEGQSRKILQVRSVSRIASAARGKRFLQLASRARLKSVLNPSLFHLNFMFLIYLYEL